MIPARRIRNPELRELAREAKNFLSSHKWCAGIRSQHLAWGIAGVVAVFFFRISPSMDDVDEELWVVVGDIPPAYIVTPKREGWQSALRGYVYEMRRWVRAARARRSVATLIPVNVRPTLEFADMLGSRLAFITREFLSPPSRSVPRNV